MFGDIGADKASELKTVINALAAKVGSDDLLFIGLGKFGITNAEAGPVSLRRNHITKCTELN